MKLFLIRHGETVDNVAGLYAGIRDSALTVHGVEQTRKLGEFFARTDVEFTHLFSSPLSRAYKTAEAIHRGQSVKATATSTSAATATEDGGVDAPAGPPDIVAVPELLEQDFGYYEGKPFYARTSPRQPGRESHAETHRLDPGFVDVESRESMARRADAFLDRHLLPVLGQGTEDRRLAVAIVSHGMLLATLWRRILLRLPRRSVSVAPAVTASRGPVVLEHLGGWSNTGYLEVEITRDDVERPAGSLVEEPRDPSSQEATDLTSSRLSTGSKSTEVTAADVPRSLQGCSTVILAVDSKQHLAGLKRQRGGIGRQAHDETQRTLHSFFKKPKPV